eukprot:992419-Amorphochlora_amoeboformis.AAC.2
MVKNHHFKPTDSHRDDIGRKITKERRKHPLYPRFHLILFMSGEVRRDDALDDVGDRGGSCTCAGHKD